MVTPSPHAGASVHPPRGQRLPPARRTSESGPQGLRVCEPPSEVRASPTRPSPPCARLLGVVQTGTAHRRMGAAALPLCRAPPAPQAGADPTPAEQPAGCRRRGRVRPSPLSPRGSPLPAPPPSSQPRQTRAGEGESRASHSPPASCCGFSRSPA